MKRKFVILALIVVGAVIVVGVRFSIFQQNFPAAERGRRIAEREGCFSCHGPRGIRGTGNPGRATPTVPNFEGDVMMFAEDAGQIREWIHDGVSKKKSTSKTWQRERDASALKMPAFGDKLSREEIDDLVAFVMAMSTLNVPEDPRVRHGYDRARELGCFGCHGKGGVFAPPNPGSLKGYIPSWNGKDFPELVRDRDEFAEWVEKGISDRFDKSSFARMYLNRANIKMPPYEKHLDPDDISAMWAYVQWLQEQSE